jgi:tetratricopeptide (TPR) repeat protein
MKLLARPLVVACRMSALAVALGASVYSLSALAQTAPASNPELQEVSRLVRAGQYQGAIDKANTVLATKPKDALARFLKGVSLTELGKTNDAIAIFQSITEDNPELPEPYNNLAVLYASKGQFEKARTALELAIQTHPSYSTAHENLGDVYAKLASQAYDRALQLDKGNSGVQGKLGLIKDLFSTQPRASQKPDASKIASNATAATSAAAQTVAVATPPAPAPAPVAKAEPVRVAAATAPSPAVPAPLVAPPLPSGPASGPARAIPVTAPSASTPVAVAPAPQAVAAAPAAQAQTTASAGETETVMAAVRGWANAWSKQDADRYISTYSSNFKPDDGKSRREWERERRDRVTSPSYVKVEVAEAAVVMNGDGTAEVKFRQNYDSSKLKNHSVRKTLSLVKTGAGWQIVRERNS